MPTKLRIDFAGYHHIINRGVNRCKVFISNYDKILFLQIINKASKIYKVTLHTFVLMDNHYHLLIETSTDNLASFMRVVNANYAQYFNKKYKRSGHLWQDRYQSKFIISEHYFYTLIKYIEYNPVEANITNKVSEYEFTLSSFIIKNKNIPKCSQNSFLLRNLTVKELIVFLDIKLTENEFIYLKRKQKEKIKIENNHLLKTKNKELNIYFNEKKDKKLRNKNINQAYNNGYTQVEIAKHLNVSKSLISKVIKDENEF